MTFSALVVVVVGFLAFTYAGRLGQVAAEAGTGWGRRDEGDRAGRGDGHLDGAVTMVRGVEHARQHDRQCPRGTGTGIVFGTRVGGAEVHGLGLGGEGGGRRGSAADSIRAGSQASSCRGRIVDLLRLAGAGAAGSTVHSDDRQFPWGRNGWTSFCFACLGNSTSTWTQVAGSSSLVPGSGHDARQRRCSSTSRSVPCDLLSALVPGSSLGLHGHLLGAAWSAPETAGMRSAWQVWRFVNWVVSVGREPAGGRAPVDGTGWTGPLPPPGDPAPLAPRWCRLLPWAWSLLHRVTSTPVVVSVG